MTTTRKPWRIKCYPRRGPFGIPMSKPWEVFQLKSCIVPTCGGACYRFVASFETGAEALAAFAKGSA